MAQEAKQRFHIAINMAGAVSAGAYTAGVLDFLIEALEEWEKAKSTYRAWLSGPRTDPAPQPVPLHETSIDCFSGASAGGMCAAIASALVERPFEHIRTPGEHAGTSNTLYAAWVNQINIMGLLRCDNVTTPLTSILDCQIIDEIAAKALTPVLLARPPYIAEDLTLLLTLTSARGLPYKLYAEATTAAEQIAYYADRLRFESVPQAGAPVSTPDAKPLPLNDMKNGAWPLLQQAAKATGAFPVFLAPRAIEREASDYTIPGWTPLNEPHPKPLRPDWPDGLKSFENLYVDGGVTDNDPSALAHEYLGSLHPDSDEVTADKTQSAVLTVAPFPAQARWATSYDTTAASAIAQILIKLIDAMLAQSRFQGESLGHLVEKNDFSRFVIAPTAKDNPQQPLQCSTLGAFGGFFARGFREHDFLLGRRNCQKFLSDSFKLPESNAIIARGLAEAGDDAPRLRTLWSQPAPASAGNALPHELWLPLIPLFGSALTEQPEPARETITEQQLQKISAQTVRRLQAILPALLAEAPSILRWLVERLVGWPFSIKLRSWLYDFFKTQLGDNVKNC